MASDGNGPTKSRILFLTMLTQTLDSDAYDCRSRQKQATNDISMKHISPSFLRHSTVCFLLSSSSVSLVSFPPVFFSSLSGLSLEPSSQQQPTPTAPSPTAHSVLISSPYIFPDVLIHRGRQTQVKLGWVGGDTTQRSKKDQFGGVSFENSYSDWELPLAQ